MVVYSLLLSDPSECLSGCVEVSTTVSFLAWTKPKLTLNLGICAGKHAIAEYLIQQEGFQLLEVASQADTAITDKPSDHQLLLQASGTTGDHGLHASKTPSEFIFETAEALLNFVTKRWQEKWVTTDIADGLTLDRFLLRPFFLLVSVDAPVSLRWKRFSERYVAKKLNEQIHRGVL